MGLRVVVLGRWAEAAPVIYPGPELEFLAAYENAYENSGGGAFLRREGLYSSQTTEWRRPRDAGVLAGKKAGESIGKLSADQAENARLRRQLEVTSDQHCDKPTPSPVGQSSDQVNDVGRAGPILDQPPQSSQGFHPGRRWTGESRTQRKCPSRRRCHCKHQIPIDGQLFSRLLLCNVSRSRKAAA